VGITNGFRYFVVTSHKIKPINKNIVFIHGGGFIGEITQQHWLYIKNLIKHTQSRVYVPIYPLTTDKYSSQLDTIHFLVDFYKEITQNDSESFYYIMGDSAGGNFALVLAQQIKIFNLKKPEHLILLSPCVSMENSPEAEKQGINDPILTYNLLKTLTHWQLKDADPKNPLFSPIYGDSKDIGDIHIFIGSREFFLYFVNQ
jgi:acetyl esterase/lipase